MLKKNLFQITQRWGAFVPAGLLFFPIYLEAATSTWNVDASGNWSTPSSNWTPATVPNAVGATAAFGSVITMPRTITVDIPITVGAITIDNANAYTIAGTIADHLTLSASSGSAAITVTDVNGNGSHVIASPISLSSPLSITQGSTGTLTLSGIISGSEKITINSGSGPVEFSGVNTFTGVFELSEATTVPMVIVTSDASFGNTINTVDIVSGGSIEFSGNVGSMVSPSTRNFTTELMTMFIADSGTESVLGGVISQNSTKTTTLMVQGPGMITLTNATNNWNNATIVTNGGTLGVTNNGALGMDIPLNFVELQGGSLYIQAVSGSGGIANASRELRLGVGTSPNSIILDDGTTSSWGGIFENTTTAGALTITSPAGSLGTGILTISANNDGWTGPSLTIDNVTVKISSRTNLSQNVTSLFLNESTLQFTTTTTFLSSYAMTLGTSATFLSNSGTTNTMPGVISGGQMIIEGAGTFALSGVSNTFTGGININGGTLQTNRDANLGPTTGGFPSGSIEFTGTGGTLSFVTNSYTMSAARAVTLSAPATFQMASGIATIFNGNITGTSSLTVMGPGNLTLGGTNSYNGGTTVNSTGTLFLAGSGQLLNTGPVDVVGTFDISGLTPSGSSTTIGDFFGSGSTNLGANTLVMGTSTPTVTYSGAITGVGGGLTKQGSGTFVLSGTSNTYSGETTVNAAVFQAGAANAFSPNSQVNLPNTGVTLNVNGFSETIGSLMGVSGSSVTLGSLGTLTLGGDNTSTTYSGVISDSGSGGSLTKTGIGIFTLTGANTYIGGTSINAGVISISETGNLGTGSVAFIGSSTLQMNAAINNFNLPISIANGITGTIDTDGNNSTISSAITDATTNGSLQKIGLGTLTLSGIANTYSGTTTVSAGILQAGATNAFSPNSQVSLANTSGVELNLNNFSQTIASLTGAGATGGNVTLGSGTLTLGGDGTSTTYAGAITGAGGITKQGSGTFTLSGTSNAYSGETTVNVGVLQAGAANAFSSSSQINLANTSGVTLNVNSFSETIGSLTGGGTNGGNVTLGTGSLTLGGDDTTTTYAGVISDSGSGGSLIKQGTGVFTLTGANTYIGGTSINAGVISIGATSNLGTGSVAFIGSSTLQMNAAISNFNLPISIVSGITGTIDTDGNNSTISSAITDATTNGSLQKIGLGTLTLSGIANTYSGTTTVSAGILQAGATNAFSPNSQVNLSNVSGVTLDVNSFSETIGSLTGGGTTGGNVTLGTGSLTLGGDGTSTTYSGVISDSGSGGSLTKTGIGVFTLTGVNTYIGGTTISAGTLALTGSGSLYSSGSVDVVGTFDISGLTPTGSSTTIGDFSGSGLTNLGANTLVMGTSTPTVTYSGAITGVGGSLTKQGTGTFVLSGTSNYSGETTLNAGIFQAGISGAFSSSSQVSLANVAGATLDVNGFSETIGSLTGGGTTGGNVTLGTGSLTLGGDGTSTTYSGVISDSGSGGSVTKTGSGVFTLTGANTYIGGTTISAGTFALTGSGSLYSSGSVDVVGTFDISGLTPSGSSATIGDFFGSGSTNLGANTLVMGTSTPTVTYSGAITGIGGSLSKQGSGTFVLSGTSNTYSGETTVDAGVFTIGAVGAFPSGNDLTMVGGTFEMNNNDTIIGTISGTGGTVNIGSFSTSVLTIEASSGSFGGIISGSGGLSKTTGGTLTLSNGSNSYSGTTTVSAGIFEVGAVGAFPSGNDLTMLGGTFEMNDNDTTIGTISGTAGTVNIGSLSTSVLTIEASSGSFDGTITGSGELSKTTSGTLTLSNASNSYSGNTSIQGGVLSINGDVLGSGNVTIGNAGTLMGTADFTLLNTPIILGTGSTIDVTPTNTMILSGELEVGSLMKTNSGTLTLTNGSNSYIGGTTISAGTLALSGAGSLLSTGAVTANGTFDISGITAAGLTIGDLSGDGTVTLGSKTLTEGTSNSTTFSGVIQGTGALHKDGSGVLTLSGMNTYSGGTEINDGTIQITADANIGNADGGLTFAGSGGTLEMVNGVTLSSSRLLTFTSSGTLQTDTGESVFAGTMIGSATLTTQGSGSLSLNGSSPAFLGDINVVNGSLFVNGDLSSSGLTTVSSGTLLGGTGTLHTVSISGILSPSDSVAAVNAQLAMNDLSLKKNLFLEELPIGAFFGGVEIGSPVITSSASGILTATQFTFNSGSTYEVMISGNATDEIIATDTITILPGSTLDVFPVNPTANSYVIASAAHGVSGTFSTVINNFPRFNFTVNYSNPDEIILGVGMMGFSTLVTTVNAKNLAVCFDAVIDLASNDQADVNLLLAVLNYLDVPAIQDAFNQFDPAVYGAVNIAELDSSEGILEVYRNHMSHYWKSFSACEGRTNGMSRQMQRKNSAKKDSSCPDFCGVDSARYSFWAAPVGMKTSRDKTQDPRAYSGYKNTTYGIATGVDYQCIDDLFVTLGASYTSSQMKWRDAPVRAHYDSYAGIIGTSFMNSIFYVEASLAGIYHSVSADRKVVVAPSTMSLGGASPINYDIKNHNNALSVASGISAACNLYETTTQAGTTFSLWPYANLDYLYVHQFAYTEKDGGALNMHMDVRNTDLLTPETGLGISVVKDACNFLFYTDVSVGYSWEFRYQGEILTTQFVKDPGCLVELTGLFPKSNLVVPRIDIGLQRPNEKFYFFLSYKGSVSSSFTNNQVTAEFKVSF